MTAEYCIFANRTNNLYQNRRLAARLQTVERYYLNYEETVDIRAPDDGNDHTGTTERDIVGRKYRRGQRNKQLVEAPIWQLLRLKVKERGEIFVNYAKKAYLFTAITLN